MPRLLRVMEWTLASHDPIGGNTYTRAKPSSWASGVGDVAILVLGSIGPISDVGLRNHAQLIVDHLRRMKRRPPPGLRSRASGYTQFTSVYERNRRDSSRCHLDPSGATAGYRNPVHDRSRPRRCGRHTVDPRSHGSPNRSTGPLLLIDEGLPALPTHPDSRRDLRRPRCGLRGSPGDCWPLGRPRRECV